MSQKININDDVLMQFPEFAAYKGEKRQKETASNEITQLNPVEDESTPQEILDHAYEEVNDALAVELLDEVRNMDPYKFEQLVVDLLIKMGYGKLQYGSRTTKKSGDEGIDGIVTADKLGFDSVYIQAKRFKDVTVGSPEIQKFVGALAGQGATKGIFITTSSFSRAAEEYAAKNQYCKIVLVDGKRLSELMLEYEIGVSTAYVYKIRKIDTDYFVDE